MKNRLHLTICPLVGGRWAPFVENYLITAHRLLRSPVRNLSLAIVDEALMRQLHRRYLKTSASTDVLSFELDTDTKGRVLAGQIVICLPVARRGARQRGLPISHELLLYALHGLLHLSGWDDKTNKGFRAMHAKEDQILIQLGIGPVFRKISPSPRYSGKRVGARGRIKHRENSLSPVLRKTR